MKDVARILLFLGAFAVLGAALGGINSWSSFAYEIAFGMVIGGAVLWPFLAWQDELNRAEAEAAPAS